MKGAILGLALAVLSTSVLADDLHERLAIAAQNIQINEIVTVPIKNLKAIESDGQIVFMSENGRFVLIGQMIDVWHRKSLDTMSQIKQAVTNLSFDSMGLDIDELNTISVGQGRSQVVAFVDPLCPACIQLINDAEALAEQYTFKFVFVPALGAESAEIAKKVSCSTDKVFALEAIRNGTGANLSLSESCDSHSFNATLISADLMGVNGVPFIVAPNGEIFRGLPENLSDWLKTREQ